MKKTLLGLLVVGLVTVGGVTSARAQSADPALVNIPFRFVVDGKLLPAGRYRISALAADSAVLLVENTNGRPAVFVATVRVAANPDETGSASHVTFRSYDGQHFLSMVSVPGEDAREIPLRTGAMDQMLARLNLLPAERADAGAK